MHYLCQNQYHDQQRVTVDVSIACAAWLLPLACRDANDRQLVHFYVGCSKGTYVRTLGYDLATSLGSTGRLTKVSLHHELT